MAVENPVSPILERGPTHLKPRRDAFLKADPITHLTTTTKTTLGKTAFAVLLFSLGTACAGADSARPDDTTVEGTANDSANSATGANAVDGEKTGDVASAAKGAPDNSGPANASGNQLARGAVNLGTAGNFAVLSKSGVSTVPPSVITGDLGVSPIAATAITGFSLVARPTNVFSTSTQVTGRVYAANYAVPTPSNLTTAVLDMQTAFTDAASRAPKATELGAGNIGGLTFTPGVYKWGSGVVIPTNVTLSGSATDVWIFQIAQNLAAANATKIILHGGAMPKNIFWQVSGRVDVGTTAHFEGIVLCQTGISLATGASINGRLLAQTAVTLDSSTVVQPAP